MTVLLEDSLEMPVDEELKFQDTQEATPCLFGICKIKEFEMLIQALVQPEKEVGPRSQAPPCFHGNCDITISPEELEKLQNRLQDIMESVKTH